MAINNATDKAHTNLLITDMSSAELPLALRSPIAAGSPPDDLLETVYNEVRI